MCSEYDIPGDGAYSIPPGLTKYGSHVRATLYQRVQDHTQLPAHKQRLGESPQSKGIPHTTEVGVVMQLCGVGWNKLGCGEQ